MTRRWTRGGMATRRFVVAPSWPFTAASTLALLALVETAQREPGSPVALVLATGVTLPLALCRAAPSVAAGLLAAGVLLSQQTGTWLPAAGVLALAAGYVVLGLSGPTRNGVLAVVPFVAYAAVPASAGATGGRVFAVVLAAVTAAGVAVGAVRRSRAETARREVADRTIADTLLEHAARGERARIARELHDVVAHHISMIAVQAEAARLTVPGMPDEGARRLTAIGDTARTALTEMRRLLGVLREDAGAQPTRRPQPGLRQLNDLVDEVRDVSGASTRLIVRGHVAPLNPGLELTAYRIVQEALTNVRRHAAGAAVDVELDYGATQLRLRIRDNGPGGPSARTGPSGDGHGLAGMRERVTMVGGDLVAGPAPRGGFQIEARLPLPAAVT